MSHNFHSLTMVSSPSNKRGYTKFDDSFDLNVPLSERLFTTQKTVTPIVDDVVVLDDDSDQDEQEIPRRSPPKLGSELCRSFNGLDFDDSIVIVESDEEAPKASTTDNAEVDSGDVKSDAFLADFLSPPAKKSKKKRKTPKRKTPLKKVIEPPKQKSPAKRSVDEQPKKKKEAAGRDEVRKRKELQAKCEKAVREQRNEETLKRALHNCRAAIDCTLLDDLFTKDELHRQMCEYLVNYEIDEFPKVASSVRWIRKKTALEFDNVDNNEMGFSVNKQDVDEDHLLCVIKMPEFVKMVHAYKLDDACDQTLFDCVKMNADKAQCKTVTVLVHGVKGYFRHRQNKATAEFRAAMDAIDGKQSKKSRRKSAGLPVVDRSDIDDALVDLDFRSAECGLNVSVAWSDTSDEVTRMIAATTKAVAEAPFKRRRNEQEGFAWYVQADSVCSVAPTNSDEAEKLWRRQLQQFPKMSHEMADSIARTFKTPLSLMEAYDTCDTETGAMLLADIMIGVNGTRRLGPEMSRRLYMFFAGIDGDKFIASQ